MKAHNLCAWLENLEELDPSHIRSLVLHFSDKKYGVFRDKDLRWLKGADMDEILKDHPLVVRKVVKHAFTELKQKNQGWFTWLWGKEDEL